ncbi:unnamed protein product [Nezara viridula]|uniref:Uncharacterized protein n=1 Tax=Nezara viridula TaxID=85310 RepID=A0A9P0H0P9_NEZVI|nr:unnamed protein product [Nezara viridula]
MWPVQTSSSHVIHLLNWTSMFLFRSPPGPEVGSPNGKKLVLRVSTLYRRPAHIWLSPLCVTYLQPVHQPHLVLSPF